MRKFWLVVSLLLAATSREARAQDIGAEPAGAPEAIPAQVPLPTVSGEAAVATSSPVTPVLSLDQAALEAGIALEDHDPRASQSKLEIYGFSDFTYSGFAMPKSSRWNGYVNRSPSMGIGNLNVYFKGNLSERARSLIEIRFMYLPNGQQQIQADGSIKYMETTVLDPLELNRLLKWGGIVVERAWLEYELHEFLTVRAGQFLTPYGIWNVDHGSPTIIGIRRPFVVTEAILPERQTGLELYGRLSLASGLLGYHLTVSNGRDPGNEYQDRDSNKAVGGRVFGTSMAVGELTGGFSFFLTKRAARKEQVTVGADGSKVFSSIDIEKSKELGLSADVKWRWKDLHVQAELVTRRRDYDDNARERLKDYPLVPSFAPDNFKWGAYGLVGYRTPLLGIMPYVLLERLNFPTGDIPSGMGLHFGLNYRPEPALVLKAEVLHAWFPGALKTSFGADTLTTYALQAAWVF